MEERKDMLFPATSKPKGVCMLFNLRVLEDILADPINKKEIRKLLVGVLFEHVPIPILVLPGGRMPVRKNDSEGFDASIRALVHPTEMSKENPMLRKTVFDFENEPKNGEMRGHTFHELLNGDLPPHGGLVYRLWPGEKILAGVGFAVAMPFPMLHWVTPRSGLATRHHITLENAPGTVDSDYRGEAGVLILNKGNEAFDLYRGIRIAQIVFMWAVIPELVQVKSHEDLPATGRGSGGFGSTGLE